MTDQAYAVQKAVYDLLAASSTLTALVPVANTVDDHGGLPTRFPGIILGEAQIVDEGQRIDRSVVRVFSTWHVWTNEPNLNGVKRIGAAFRAALDGAKPTLSGGYHLGDLLIEDTRYIRDPKGENGHGVITLNALVGKA